MSLESEDDGKKESHGGSSLLPSVEPPTPDLKGSAPRLMLDGVVSVADARVDGFGVADVGRWRSEAEAGRRLVEWGG